MKTKRILLAGATGYLRQFIMNELIRKEYPLKIIVRNKQKIAINNQNLQIIEAQITRPQTLKGSCKDIDVVISTVGITRQKDKLTYMDVDYGANLNLLNEAEQNGVKKFIYVSALNGEKLRHLKIADAKERFVDELKNSGLDYCIIRPNGFFSDMTKFLKMAQ